MSPIGTEKNDDGSHRYSESNPGYNAMPPLLLPVISTATL